MIPARGCGRASGSCGARQFRCDGQFEEEHGAAPFPGLETAAPVESLHEGPDDRKAESGSLTDTLIRTVRLGEFLEQTVAELDRHARPLVLDADPYLARERLEP